MTNTQGSSSTETTSTVTIYGIYSEITSMSGATVTAANDQPVSMFTHAIPFDPGRLPGMMHTLSHAQLPIDTHGGRLSYFLRLSM